MLLGGADDILALCDFTWIYWSWRHGSAGLLNVRFPPTEQRTRFYVGSVPSRHRAETAGQRAAATRCQAVAGPRRADQN
jgi:hypothetical protein